MADFDAQRKGKGRAVGASTLDRRVRRFELEKKMVTNILPLKELQIGLLDGDDQYISFLLHRNDHWEFKWSGINDERNGRDDFVLQEMPVEALIELRDFLNYALPNAEITGSPKASPG